MVFSLLIARTLNRLVDIDHLLPLRIKPQKVTQGIKGT
jgi:hypothetical protein